MSISGIREPASSATNEDTSQHTAAREERGTEREVGVKEAVLIRGQGEWILRNTSILLIY